MQLSPSGEREYKSERKGEKETPSLSRLSDWNGGRAEAEPPPGLCDSLSSVPGIVTLNLLQLGRVGKEEKK